MPALARLKAFQTQLYPPAPAHNSGAYCNSARRQQQSAWTKGKGKGKEVRQTCARWLSCGLPVLISMGAITDSRLGPSPGAGAAALRGQPCTCSGQGCVQLPELLPTGKAHPPTNEGVWGRVGDLCPIATQVRARCLAAPRFSASMQRSQRAGKPIKRPPAPPAALPRPATPTWRCRAAAGSSRAILTLTSTMPLTPNLVAHTLSSMSTTSCNGRERGWLAHYICTGPFSPLRGCSSFLRAPTPETKQDCADGGKPLKPLHRL